MEIKDMVRQCKCCGGYFFAESINKNGLCFECAKGNANAKEDDEPNDWDDFT